MDNKSLISVALRYKAIFLDIAREDIDMQSEITLPVMVFVSRLRDSGFCVSEELLHALSGTSTDRLAEIALHLSDIMRTDLNWAPLVKGWDVPTGETRADHLVTWAANFFGTIADGSGTMLPCGHLIPKDTFPIERYNGCPFCGTPFSTTHFVYKGQGSRMKELRLFTRSDMKHTYISLLTSATPLDATQKDSLQQLLRIFPLPDDIHITMKETVMLVISALAAQDKADQASKWLQTPADILRFLWYEKTGYTQVIEPKTLIAHAQRLYYHMWGPLDCGADAAANMKEKLRLKYDRKACRRVAQWLNAVPMTGRQAAENMNPKRGMWVRMIRALRLGEYARRPGYAHLAEILDTFYHQDYTTWQGHVDEARKALDADKALSLLKERPGCFARSLFASMLRYGSDKTLDAFSEVADRLPARLLLSLGNAAESYFDTTATRLVRPITGCTHQIGYNRLLTRYSEDERKTMAEAVDRIYRSSMERRFAMMPPDTKTIYIDPALYDIPVSIGDRTTTVQDTSCALMGTRFPVEGDAIRLFMQWGKGLHAQHLDMDLSCRITLPDDKTADCAYYHLTCVGAKHSGDIRSIPEMVGTAEYIELSLPELEAAGARYVTFTCNAYSTGALAPNLVVGWMDSAYPMTVSEQTGVAYDPSCVQHMIRIGEGNLSKGLVFGVLDVSKRVIIWLEMPFTSQTIGGARESSVRALLHRLETKLSIGQLLDIKTKAQHLEQVETADEADEAYTYEWALNPAEVSRLLVADTDTPCHPYQTV